MREDVKPGPVLYEHRWLVPPVQLVITAVCWGPLIQLYIGEGGALFPGWDVATMGLVFIALLPFAFWWYAVRWVNHAVRIDPSGVWIDGELAIPADRITAVVRSYDDNIAFTMTVGDRSAFRPTSNSYVARHQGHGIVHVPRHNDHNRVSWLSGAIVITDRRDAVLEREATEPAYVGWFLSSYRTSKLLSALVEIAPRVEAIEG